MVNISILLKETWDNIKYYEGGSLQLSIKHPLEWHVAYVTPTCKALVIISKFQINNIDSSKSINTVCNKRADGLNYISFQLLENSQEDVFISMCSNLIEYSFDALNEREALKRVAIRYRQWRRLMENTNLAILSDSKRRGLIGELLFLQSKAKQLSSYARAIAGWVGPDGADQDFVYNGKWIEIKTTGLSSDNISIHSLEQLGNKNDYGELCIFRVDKCAPETDDSFSIRSLINNIIKDLNGDLKDIELFTTKLSTIGYIDMDIYDKFLYKFYHYNIYDVTSDFPRITRHDVPNEVINIEYTLSISAIERWKRA